MPVKNTYTAEEFNRQTHFTISVGPDISNIEIPVAGEASLYAKIPNRRVLIVPGNERERFEKEFRKYREFQEKPVRLAYVMNWSFGKIGYADMNSMGKPEEELANSLIPEAEQVQFMQRMKMGLVIVEPGADESFIAKLPTALNRSVDYLICKRSIQDITAEEAKVCTSIRIHSDPSWNFSDPASLVPKMESIWETLQDAGLGIMLCLYMANVQFSIFTNYLIKEADEKGENFYDFLDEDAMEKRNAYHLYYLPKIDKIFGCSPKFLYWAIESFFTTIIKMPVEIDLNEMFNRFYLEEVKKEESIKENV